MILLTCRYLSAAFTKNQHIGRKRGIPTEKISFLNFFYDRIRVHHQQTQNSIQLHSSFKGPEASSPAGTYTSKIKILLQSFCLIIYFSVEFLCNLSCFIYAFFFFTLFVAPAGNLLLGVRFCNTLIKVFKQYD